MPSKKIVCLGGGSLYFPGAMADVMKEKDLRGSELMLYDLDGEKAGMMAEVGRRLAREAGTGFQVRSTTRLAEATDGADFALSSIGGSGAEVCANVHGSSFHSADMHIAAKYGVHQVIGDTAGPGGMMMALRSVPAYLEICREMEKRCPKAILFNHSNPMAVLMRAMHKYSSINAIGVCHGVQGGINRLAKFLGLEAGDLQCLWIGTNHYYWLTRIVHKGRDIYGEVLEKVRKGKAPEGSAMSYLLSDMYGYVVLYARDDHAIEFYPFLAQVPGGQKALPYGLMEPALKHDFDESKPPLKPGKEDRKAFFAKYRRMVHERGEQFGGRGKAKFGEEIGGTLAAIATGKRKIFIANIANKGAIANLPAEAEVEVEALTDWCGVRSLSMGEAPLALKGLLEKRFVWQELVADAAVTGDRRLALQAMLTDEMAIWPEKAKAMLDEMLAASRKLLPRFFRKR